MPATAFGAARRVVVDARLDKPVVGLSLHLLRLDVGGRYLSEADMVAIYEYAP
jgi:hypothetical protein